MEIPFKKLQTELEKNLSFWLENSIEKDSKKIYSAVSINGIPDASSPLGSMYLSRIVYGASIATKMLKIDDYRVLADISFEQLQEMQHPKGGYYWARDNSGTFLHDAENNCMAQAFILYGLATYATINPSEELDISIEKQLTFIKNTLYDTKNGGYIDGFNSNWVLGENPTKSLGTHLHLLEAFVKLYEYQKNEDLVILIEELINIILTYFITNDTYDCLHRLTLNWDLLPNEVWAGHNAEVSWILCNSAKAIQNKKLISECNDVAIKMMQQVILKAWDSKNQGVFNVLMNGSPTEKVKIWWPQAETILGLLNCYSITKDKSYKNRAIELINYISNNFIAPNGEWYTEIWNTRKPNTSLPIIHFWKSMYHTIRYYAIINEIADS
jgi:mannobiose 2-epimerase